MTTQERMEALIEQAKLLAADNSKPYFIALSYPGEFHEIYTTEAGMRWAAEGDEHRVNPDGTVEII